LTFDALRAVLRDTMAVTGALFALLVAATMFTLIVRGFGTDRWVAAMLQQLPGRGLAAVFVVLPILALCALVLDAFELIFVVVPVVMPPLLTVVPAATWVAVLTLLILQASFLLPPFGYAVLMVRSRSPRHVPTHALTRALLPYLVAQLAVLTLILAAPGLVWQRNPTTLSPAAASEPARGDAADSVPEPQFDVQPDDAAGKPASKD
jgi:TRAP-type mannitol/chloroaromatic compound transport system permease large subunit